VRFDVDAHADELFTLFHEPSTTSVWTFLRDGPFESPSAYREHLSLFSKKKGVVQYIVLDDSRVIGKLALIHVSPRTPSVEIAYVTFAPSVHGSGAAIIALSRLLDYVFFDMGKSECVWKCDSMNHRSSGFARKMGFVFLKELTADFVVKSRLRNTLTFSQSLEQWRDHRRRILQRLGAHHR
jgi:RimJ/RimL family protein N-acetyltransferase